MGVKVFLFILVWAWYTRLGKHRVSEFGVWTGLTKSHDSQSLFSPRQREVYSALEQTGLLLPIVQFSGLASVRSLEQTSRQAPKLGERLGSGFEVDLMQHPP